MATSEQTIGSVDRAADILEFLYERNGECALSEIAAGLGLYKSTVHRMLATLRGRGYVYQNPVTAHYGLGQRLFLLGSRVHQNTAIVELVKPIAQGLVERYNECVHLTVPYTLGQADELPRQMLIGKIMNPRNVLTVAPPVGAVTLCHCSASGKCMLAYGPAAALERARHLPLSQLTENTITQWPLLEEQLKRIRSQGYAEEDGETELGLSCTAVPVPTSGAITLVLSISGPTSRLRSLDKAGLVADLAGAAKQMAGLLA